MALNSIELKQRARDRCMCECVYICRTLDVRHGSQIAFVLLGCSRGGCPTRTYARTRTRIPRTLHRCASALGQFRFERRVNRTSFDAKWTKIVSFCADRETENPSRFSRAHLPIQNWFESITLCESVRACVINCALVPECDTARQSKSVQSYHNKSQITTDKRTHARVHANNTQQQVDAHRMYLQIHSRERTAQ